MQLKPQPTNKTRLFFFQFALLLFTMVFINTSANAQADCVGNCDTATPCFNVNLPTPNASVPLTVFGGPGNCCAGFGNVECLQLYITYPAGTAGMEISSTSSPSPCSNDLYESSGGCGAYTGPFEFCEPYCPDPATIDPNGGIFEFTVCKPGNFVDVDIIVTGVPAIVVTTPDVNDNGADCAPTFSVFGVPVGEAVTWSPTTYLTAQDPDFHKATFLYTGTPVVDCNGIDLVYDITIPATSCEVAYVETRTVKVYPSTQGSIDVVCSGSDLNMNFIPDVPCGDLLYQWYDENNVPLSGETGPTISLTENENLYTLEVWRDAVDACAPFSISALATCCQPPQFVSCPSDLVITTTDPGCLTVNFPTPAATSNCGPVTVTQIAGLTSGSDFVLGVPENIIFEAENVNGQTTLCSFTITLVLDVELTLYCPFDVDVCSDPGTCSWISEGLSPITSADCGTLELTYEVSGATTVPSTPGDANGVVFNQGISFVTYTLTDPLNLALTEVCSFSVTVNDCEGPILTCPTSITDVECGTEDVLAWAGTASAIDVGGCNFVNIDYFLQSTTELCGEAQIDTYLFIATDAAGNSTSCVASYGTVDTSPPTINTPSTGLDLECDGNSNATEILAWLNNNGGATATDECSPVFWSNNYASVDNPCVNGTVTVTFTATDECGNTATTQADIVINDTTAPTWVLQPSNLTIECDGTSDPLDQIDSWLNIAGGGEADDDCSFVIYSNDFMALSDECGVTGSATVTFTASDVCGNTATATAVVTVVDNTPPSIELPAQDLVVECDGSGNTTELTNWLSANGNAVANDACSTTFTWANTLVSTTLNCGGTEIQTYAFTATDECDNISVQTSASFIIEDTTPPTIQTPPSSITVQCDGNGNLGDLNSWLANQGGAAATDLCSSPLSWGYVLVGEIDSCGLTGTNTYRFIVADDCGNTSFAEASFTIEDLTAPVIDTEAQPETVECDGNGNVAELLAWLNTNGGAAASDICSGVTWTNNYSAFNYNCAFAGSTTVIFTASDECGNTSTTTATFTINDTTNPELTVPPGIELECNDPANEEIIALWLLGADGSDGCGDVAIANNYDTAPFVAACGNTGEYTVTFTATDDCANTTTLTSTITIVDTEDPEFIILPQPLVVDCDDETNQDQIDAWILAFANASAIDDCDGDVELSITVGATQTVCGGSTITEYTVTATDDCDNFVSYVTTVFVEDTTGPVITLPDAPDNVYCDDDVVAAQNTWLASVDAVDNCGGGVTIQYYLLDVQEICVGDDTHINKNYLFEATDECGNVSIAEDVFTIYDDISPAITAPENLILSCGDQIGAAVANWLLDYTVVEACQDYVVSNDYDGTVPDLCGGSLTVTWTVIDPCGANSSASADLIITDDVTGPEFQNCSDDLIVRIDIDLCGTSIVYSTPVAFDCNEPVTVEQTSPTNLFSGDEFPLGDTEVTFTATDRCGNTSLCTFTITVEDSQIPSLECPSNDVVVCASETMSCDWTGDSSVDPIYGDNCPNQVLTYSIVNPDASVVTGDGIISEDAIIFTLGTSVVTYTLIDGSGNQVTCSFNVVVEDCTDPIITCPDDLVLECADEGNDAAIAGWNATATDNCDADPLIDKILLNTIQGCGNTETSLYLFTATDDAGNVDYCFANVIIIDTTVPVIDNEAQPLTVECDGNGNVAELLAWISTQGGAVASDLCGEVTWTNDYNQFTYACAFTGSTTVTFTATDECGNASSTTATFTIVDTTNPDLTVPPGIELECNDPANEEIIALWLLSVYGSDGCGDVTLTNDWATAPFVAACGNTGEYTVTFTATDDCANTTTESSTVTIVDTQAPEFIVLPQPLVVDCDDENNQDLIDAWEAVFANASAVDECGEVTLSIVAGEPQIICGGSTITEYTITATDECDNSLSAVTTLTIEDTTLPVITLPDAPDDVYCDDDVVAAQDAWLASVSAVDECGGGVTIQFYLLDIQEICVGDDTHINKAYLFEATDECGNVSTAQDTFTIYDDVSPLILAPDDLVLSCEDEIGAAVAAWLLNYTVIEACQFYFVTNDFDGNIPDLCGGSLTVTWTVSDLCGATTSASADLIITEDITGPIFQNCPDDLTVNVDIDLCGSNVVYSSPVAFDCNDPVTVEQTSPTDLFSGDEFPLGDTEVTFTATDACGNTSLCTFTITVVDSQIPSLECPSNDVVVCASATESCDWIGDTAVDPIFNDNCPNQVLTYSIVNPDASVVTGDGIISEDAIIFTLGTSVVTYTLIDGSGNQISCSFNVVVEDCTDPIISCPDDLVLECADEGNDAAIAGWNATATDNCDADPLIDKILLNTIQGCGNTETSLYLFTATDDAGNVDYCFANVIIIDTTVPVIDNEAQPLTVECDGNGNVAELLAWISTQGGAVASDLCGEVSWTNNYSAFNYDCAFTGSTTVTFTATDECGNASSTSATFTIEDTTNPELTVPPGIELDCNDPVNEEITALWLLSADGSDGCGDVTITNDWATAPFVSACGNTGEYTVTFTATDDCANTTTLTSTVTIVDDTAPIITSPAQDVVTECGPENDAELSAWLAENGEALAADECSDTDNLTWQEPELFQTIEQCGNTVTYVYRFRAVDECDNVSAFTTGIFTIEDTTPPSFGEDVAENLTVECDGTGNLVERDAWLADNGGATATDICGGVLTWNWDLISTIDQCGYTGTYTYRFTVTDECGNSDYTEADFIIEDTTAPDIEVEASNLEVECDGANNAAEILNWLNGNGGAVASEDCGIIIWTNDYGTIDGGCGGASGSVEVTFTATDECGNTNSTTATFTIDDTEDPIWEILPQDLTIECDGTDDPYDQINAWLNTVGGGEAEDDCSYVIYDNDFDELTDGCSENTGSALVTFTATDACLNEITATATVTVVDTYAPIIYTMARDTVVECDGEGNQEDLANWLANNGGAEALDACSEPLTWEYELLDEIDLCGGSIVWSYSFRAIDDCGNVSANTVASFTIAVTFETLEVIVQDSLVQCDGAGNLEELFAWLELNTQLIVTDPCFGSGRVEHDLVAETDLCGSTGEGIYRFTIIDECGNILNSAEASFTIVDTIAPVISGGMDMSMEECADPPAGNYPEFDDWLTNNAYATADDVCGELNWSNNFHPDNWEFQCGNTRFVEVTFYATDVCGNVDSIMHEFSIGDNTPPEFTNCPRPDIVVDVHTNSCEAYVNFSMPLAEDNCNGAVVTQTDDTGLSSGDMFPVGCTVLEFTATDDCGNTTLCYMRVIVNDNTPPQIECPEDIDVVNDPGLCGAVINDIGVETEDNCPGNVSVIYEIFNESDELIGSGLNDASGTEFPAGNNTVVYTAFDQPIFLITEVVQDGTVSGIEIGNFGPAALDLGCAVVARTNSSLDEEYTIPHGNVIMAGEVFTYEFSSIPAGEVATYSISMVDRLIDEVTINDGLDGVDIFRINPVDTDTDEDFEAANICNDGSFGFWNPQLPHFNDNGSLTGMQSEDPSESSCSFQVNVTDEESPRCASGNRDASYSDGGLVIDGENCVRSVFTVQPGIIADINLIDFQATVDNAGLVTVLLTSPWGEEITLLDGVCENTSDIDVNLDDSATSSVVNAPCSPLGNGDTFAPQEGFFAFFGQQAAGEWTLELYSGTPNSGLLNNWTLEFFYVEDYDQEDIEVDNDEGECGALVEWQHPLFLDNCVDGIMTAAYHFSNDVTGEFYIVNETLLSLDGSINMDGTMASRFFDVGVTEVVYTLIDAQGLVGTCGFTVTVNDVEAPTFPLGCVDQTINLEAGECDAYLSNLPFVEDNCQLESLLFEFEGELVNIPNLPIGINEVTAVATDIYGNSATCTFVVEIVEYIPDDGVLVCNDDINLSLNPNCEAVLTGDMILEGDLYGCYENYCIEVFDEEGNTHLNYFDYSDVGQTFLVRITDCLGTQNNCEMNVTITEKYVPEIVCPDDAVITCNADYSPEALGVVEILNCEPFAVISHSDEFVDNGLCGDPRATIIRTWTVDDNQGNVVTCEQNIEIKKSILEDVIPPADIFDLSCTEVDADPSLLEPEQSGYPTVDGIPINENNGLCMFSYTYEDDIYQYCGNSYVLLRTWKIMDVCIPLDDDNPKIFSQALRVFDFEVPEFHACEDIYISTNSYDCSGSVEIPLPMITDNCNDLSIDVIVSGAVVQTSGSWADGTLQVFASNMGIGTHVVRITATDACYNINSCVFNVIVEDNVPPIAVCEQFKQVSLTQDGTASVYAEDFDSGSFDNCNDVWVKVLRGHEIDNDNQIIYDGGCPDLNGDDNPFTTAVESWFDDQVYFCCEDLGLVHPDGIMVTLRVFEVDPGPGPVDPQRMYSPNGDLYGKFGDCWSVVELECKIPPILDAPDIEVACDANLDPEQNPDLWPEVLHACGVELSYEDSDQLGDVCSGYIERLWTATACDNTVTRIQRIYLNGAEAFDPCTIEFPADQTNITCPDVTGDPGYPTWDENPCNIVTAEIVNIDTFNFVDDACYKIVVDWAVIDWCVYEQNIGSEDNVDETNNRQLVCDGLVIDGYYRYTQILMVKDIYAPEIVVEDQCIATTSGCYAADVELEAFATDSCNVDEKFWWKYIAINMDSWDTVQYSYNYTPEPDQGVKQSRSKDKLDNRADARMIFRNPLAIGSYRIEWTVGDGCGNASSTYQYFEVRDKKAPTPFLVDISTALMTNGMVEMTARFFDKGACNGECLASFDNCSDDIYFTFTDILPVITQPDWIDPYGLYYFDPSTGAQLNANSGRSSYLEGVAHSWNPETRTSGKIFVCDDAPAVNVDVYVWDQFALNGACDDGNYDFGTVLLQINVLGDDCGDDILSAISGSTFNRNSGDKVDGVEVTLNQDNPEYPIYAESDGDYVFNNVAFGNYELKADKYNDHANGVSTLDLVVIQRHLLGIKAMDDVYNLIASDANESGSISAADILDLRKLILAITDKLPQGRSWRFIDANYDFENTDSPWNEMAVAEKIDLLLNQNRDDIDFIGIKLGDVNASINLATGNSNIESRHLDKFELLADDIQYSKDQIFKIPVYGKSDKELFGMQFTMQSGDLEIMGVKSGSLNITSQNLALHQPNQMTFSWNSSNGKELKEDEVLFYIELKATKNGVLAESLDLNSSITAAEAYLSPALVTHSIDLRLNGRSEMAFELLQNVPNPFTEQTVIEFILPAEGSYELSILDVSGKVLKVIDGEGSKGLNSVLIKERTLAPGILYYKLKTDDHIDSKKMLLIK